MRINHFEYLINIL